MNPPKADSALRRLLLQASHYSLASVLTTAAGLVTFPLLTRVFSVGEYGVMNLISATITSSVAVGKLGFQHSIIRYHSEIGAGKSRFSLPQLYSTTLLGMLVTAVAVMLLLAVGAGAAPARWFSGAGVRTLFQLASVLIVLQVIESGFVNFLRADQQTSLLMKYQVAKKYVGLGFLLFAVLIVAPTLTAFYFAGVVADSLSLTGLALWLFRDRSRPRPRPTDFSFALYKELLGFGIPMMIGYELSGIVLSLGDRYVIQGMIGEVSLGLYGAAYNLCQYVQAIFFASVAQAVMPIYTRIWDQEGPDQTAAFISRSIQSYVIFCAPVIAGLGAVGAELLPTLASDKYLPAARLLPWIISAMAIDGATSMLGAGLFIRRKTRTIMLIVLSGAALNLGLNCAAVPRLGIFGSALANVTSYALTALAMTISARSSLRFRFPWATLVRAGFAAWLMYEVVGGLLPGRRILAVLVRALAGAPIYVGLMAAIDPAARQLVKKTLRNWWPRLDEHPS